MADAAPISYQFLKTQGIGLHPDSARRASFPISRRAKQIHVVSMIRTSFVLQGWMVRAATARERASLKPLTMGIIMVLISAGTPTRTLATKLAAVYRLNPAWMPVHLCRSIAFVGLVLIATNSGNAFLLVAKPRSIFL